LSTLLAAKESLPAEHAPLVAAAECALAAAMPVTPPTPKGELSTAQTALAQALAVQTACQEKSAKVQKRVKQHMDLVTRFMEELETSDQQLAVATAEYAKAASAAQAVADKNNLTQQADGGVAPGTVPFAQPVNLAACNNLNELLAALGTLPAASKLLLSSSLSVDKPADALSHASESAFSDTLPIDVDDEPSGAISPRTAPKASPSRGDLDPNPGAPKAARIDSASLGDAEMPPGHFPEVEPPAPARTPTTFGPSSISSNAVDMGHRNSPYSGATSGRAPKKLSELSTSAELKEQCGEWAKIVETALRNSGSAASSS
jgi:hypothetical protein